ncbi:MAG: hypothetical protein KKF48_02395 [Nanoarchaeota archaeon]|nr:hypothetical protein [Nanoarchaeota archaeon]MBU1027870.1 hypothetical protein [Nanoarchaeota archaeon]
MLKKDKIVEKDVGYAEDSFALLKQSMGQEEHFLGNFIDSKSEKDLKKLNEARNIRTELLNSIIEVMGIELKGQNWCILKHVCATAMHTQELINRCSMMGLTKIASRLAECHKLLYLNYLELLGINENNISNKTSA